MRQMWTEAFHHVSTPMLLLCLAIGKVVIIFVLMQKQSTCLGGMFVS